MAGTGQRRCVYPGRGQVRKEYKVHLRFQSPPPEPVPWYRKLLWWAWELTWSVAALSMYPLAILLLLHFFGSRAPDTDLLTLAVHDLNVTRANASAATTPWLANGNFTVVFNVQNPSQIVGFDHRDRITIVSAFFHDTLLGRSELPPFKVKISWSGYASNHHSRTANVVFSEQRLNESVGEALQRELRSQASAVGLRFTMHAYVQAKTLAWHRPKWFNLSCSVNASLAHDVVQGPNGLAKLCTRSPDWKPRIT